MKKNKKEHIVPILGTICGGSFFVFFACICIILAIDIISGVISGNYIKTSFLYLLPAAGTIISFIIFIFFSQKFFKLK